MENVSHSYKSYAHFFWHTHVYKIPTPVSAILIPQPFYGTPKIKNIYA